MTFEEFNKLSSTALVQTREIIETALEEHFFDSSMSENEKARYINFAQIVTQVSTSITANIILQYLNEEQN